MAVKLTICDEVNIKFSGLSLDARKKLAATFKYEIPYAKYQPAYRLGRWDGTVSLFGIGGSGYLSQLESILDILSKMGIQLDEVDDQRNPINLTFDDVTETYWADQGKVWPPGHPTEGAPIMLRDYQVAAINKFLKNPQSLQEIATGAGKCQPLNSLVLTSTGWKTMGDIKIGDLVVTPTGKLSKVISVFEPGVKDIYQLTFSDGRTAKSCKDHLWRVHNIDWKTNSGHWRNISTEELIKLKSNTKRSIGIPLVSMKNNDTDVDLPMDPWLLGFLLGDGSFRNGRINFSTSDSELVNKVESKLNNRYKVKHLGKYDYTIQFADLNDMRASHSELMKIKSRNKNGHIINNNHTSLNEYRQIINELGLGETYSHNKFVPKMYFNSSFNQRIELIKGLVDSDGTVDTSSVSFTSVSKQLALDFQQLIWSVGGIAKIATKEKNTYKYNNDIKFGKTSYRVSTKYTTPWELISLQRKIDKTNLFYQYGPTLKLNIEHIEKIGSEDVKCILIDDPDHLYITDNYIVTHNTITTATLSQICEKFGRTIIIVPNKSLVEQTEEDFINCGLDVGVYYGDRKDLYKTHTICTWQSLNILDKKSKNHEHDIISLAEFLDNVKAVIVDECFDGNAKVLSADGSYVPIKDIKSGDKIINYSEETKAFKVDTVINQHKNLNKSNNEKMYELEFDNGSIIKVTGNHKFLTTIGWVRADELTDMHYIINKT